MASGYKFPILNSDGTASSTVVDMSDMFVRKELFLDAGVWSIGLNTNGQLGDGSVTKRSSPVQVGSLTNWKQIAAGDNHTVAAKTDGTLWAWGNNNSGQLGNSATANYSSPIQVGALTDWRQISCGQNHTAAIQTDGTLWTWGVNGSGQLGNGTVTSYSSPIQIGALTTWKQVAAGGLHTMAVKTDGTLWAWGNNALGQLGNSTFSSYSSPIQIGSLTTWQQVAAGYEFTLAIKTDGTLWSWGDDGYGQLGNNLINASGLSSPAQIGTSVDWQQVACGYSHTVAIKLNGSLWAWGDNGSGQLGNGTVTTYSSPIQIGALTNWKQVTAHGSAAINGFTAAIKTDGTLWTWGRNNSGQLGNATITNYSSPIQVGALTIWKQVACGNEHTEAISSPDLP